MQRWIDQYALQERDGNPRMAGTESEETMRIRNAC